jgi:hypothetical protein
VFDVGGVFRDSKIAMRNCYAKEGDPPSGLFFPSRFLIFNINIGVFKS